MNGEGNTLKRRHSGFLRPVKIRLDSAVQDEIVAEANLRKARVEIGYATSTIADTSEELARLDAGASRAARTRQLDNKLALMMREYDDVISHSLGATRGRAQSSGAMDVDSGDASGQQGGKTGTDLDAWFQWLRHSVSRIEGLLTAEQQAAEQAGPSGASREELREVLEDAEGDLREAREKERVWDGELREIRRVIRELRAEAEEEEKKRKRFRPS